MALQLELLAEAQAQAVEEVLLVAAETIVKPALVVVF